MRIASAFPPKIRQWHLGRRSPLTVAGAAAALRGSLLAPRSLFTRRARTATAAGPSRASIEAKRRLDCQQTIGRRWKFAFADDIKATSLATSLAHHVVAIGTGRLDGGNVPFSRRSLRDS